MKVLVVGADGAIGGAFARSLADRRDIVHSTSRRAASAAGARWTDDLAAPDVGGVPLPSVDVAVFCAAIASFAESRQDRSPVASTSPRRRRSRAGSSPQCLSAE
jgi:nucleoside-diphosphate-sugar epimerase